MRDNKDKTDKTNEDEHQFVVTARKWRPQTFADVTSQEFIVKTLLNSIKNHRISHAYLFTGPRGVGKTTIARLLAKAVNCKNRKDNGEPCNNCESCNEINTENRNHPDVFEIDGASNRNIEDIRELKEKVKYGPLRSKYKVFIIDEVHMLTGASFNALLKTLEEPPSYIVFIFATTSPEKVPLTILGRCQRYDFKRLTIDEIISRLKHIAETDKIKIDEESLYYIAKKGDGSMRDAQGLFDMTSAYSANDIKFEKLRAFFNIAESDIFFRISDLIKSKNGKDLLKYLDELIKNGHSLETLLEGITTHYRNLLTTVSTGTSELINESESVKLKYTGSINKYNEIELLNSLKLLLNTEYNFKYSFNQRTLFETLLIELIKLNDAKEIGDIIEELKTLKKNFKNEVPGLSTESVKNKDSLEQQDKSNSPKNKSILDIIEEQAKHEDNLFIQARQIDNDNSKSETIKPENNDPSLTGSEIWDTLLSSVESEGKKWIYSLLKKTEFIINSKNYELLINDDQYDMLIDYKDYIKSKVDAFFHENKKLEILKKSDKITGKADNTENSLTNHDKIKKILIEELKGKIVR